MWVPGHIGVRENEAALDKEPTDDHKPFSGLQPLAAKYIRQLWQKKMR